MLFSYDKHPTVYKELLWILWCSSIVDYTPGNGSLALVCIEFRMPCVLVVKNAKHQELITRRLLESLVVFINDVKNIRFHRTNQQFGLPDDTPGDGQADQPAKVPGSGCESDSDESEEE